MKMKHLIYASIIASVPFLVGNASAQSASADPTLWGIYGAHNRHDCPATSRRTSPTPLGPIPEPNLLERVQSPAP